jgi:hypothetical protein
LDKEIIKMDKFAAAKKRSAAMIGVQVVGIRFPVFRTAETTKNRFNGRNPK